MVVTAVCGGCDGAGCPDCEGTGEIVVCPDCYEPLDAQRVGDVCASCEKKARAAAAGDREHDAIEREAIRSLSPADRKAVSS